MGKKASYSDRLAAKRVIAAIDAGSHSREEVSGNLQHALSTWLGVDSSFQAVEARQTVSVSSRQIARWGAGGGGGGGGGGYKTFSACHLITDVLRGNLWRNNRDSTLAELQARLAKKKSEGEATSGISRSYTTFRMGRVDVLVK